MCQPGCDWVLHQRLVETWSDFQQSNFHAGAYSAPMSDWSCTSVLCRSLCLMPDFQHSVPVAVAVAVAVSIKPCPYRPRIRPSRCCWGVCAAIARQASRQGAEFLRKRVGGAPGALERQIRKNRTRSYMNGWTATANLRKRRTMFYVSYGVLTEFLRMNIILTYFATETATATDMERWKWGVSLQADISVLPSEFTARSTTPTERIWQPDCRHCWSVRLEKTLGPCP